MEERVGERDEERVGERGWKRGWERGRERGWERGRKGDTQVFWCSRVLTLESRVLSLWCSDELIHSMTATCEKLSILHKRT